MGTRLLGSIIKDIPSLSEMRLQADTKRATTCVSLDRLLLESLRLRAARDGQSVSRLVERLCLRGIQSESK